MVEEKMVKFGPLQEDLMHTFQIFPIQQMVHLAGGAHQAFWYVEEETGMLICQKTGAGDLTNVKKVGSRKQVTYLPCFHF